MAEKAPQGEGDFRKGNIRKNEDQKDRTKQAKKVGEGVVDLATRKRK